MGGLWEKEGWRDEVRAGRLLLLSEDLGPLLRNGGWGGISRPNGHRRGRRAGGGGGGVKGDHPPSDCESDDGFCEDDGF